MTDQSASFVGSIPEYYDSLLGPLIFNDYASDLPDVWLACSRVLCSNWPLEPA